MFSISFLKNYSLKRISMEKRKLKPKTGEGIGKRFWVPVQPQAHQRLNHFHLHRASGSEVRHVKEAEMVSKSKNG